MKIIWKGEMETEDQSNSFDPPLSSLSYATRRLLTDCLNKSEAWKILAESLGIFSNEEIHRFEVNASPASCLLQELENRLCTVGILTDRLRKCELHLATYAICGPEPLVIVKHPCLYSEFGGNESREDSLLIPFGGTLTLHCKATGLPPPIYTWFRENEELDQTGEILTIDDFGLEHVGEYCCRVSQQLPYDQRSEELVSYPVVVGLLPELPEIITQPKSETCREGTDIKITFQIHEIPSLGVVEYQWFKGNLALPNGNSKDLEILNVSNADEGSYRCFLRNVAGEVWTDEAKVTVYQAPEGALGEKAKEKFALLIGNDEYINLHPLKTPTSDVETLAKILEKLKFKVVALRNLTALEMRNALHKFCKMLLEGTYVVFYYVGHGFEIGGKCMLPVDAPTTYLRSDCLIETEVLKEIYETEPGLLVLILDMCLLVPDKESNPAIHQESHPVHKFEPSRNLITGYATTSNLGAYERSSETNGIYAKHLAKALLDHHDLPIIKVLEKVNKGVSAEGGEASAKQMPFVGHNTHKDYYFSVEVEGNEEAIQKYEDLVQHPTVMDLNFSRKNLTAKAFVTPHRGTFLNSLDIRIVGLDSWKVVFLLGNSELQLQKQWTDNGLIVTLHNLQKMKSTLMVTVELKDPHTGHTVDDDMLVLNKPLVCKWELWFRSPVNETLDFS